MKSFAIKPFRHWHPVLLAAFCVGLLVFAPSIAMAQETDTGGSPPETEDAQGDAEASESAAPQDQTPPEDVPFAENVDLAAKKLAAIDRDPFDRLYFNEFNDDWELDVDLIEIPGETTNTPIDPTKKEGRLVFTMPNYPGRKFATPWGSLIKVDRYSDLIMKEADEAMRDGDYGTAFRTLAFLLELGDGNKAQLTQMMDKCLYEDGEASLEAEKFGEALASFEELYKRSPGYKIRGAGGVIGKVTLCIDKFIGDKVNTGDFESARSLLETLRLEYGDKVEDVIAAWEKDMYDKAIVKLREIRILVDEKKGMAAHEGVRQVMYLMPNLRQSTTAYNAIVKDFPYIFVGVTQQADSQDVRRIEDWAARRVGYLVNRWLMEFKGPGDEGGIYEFPSGRIQRIDDLGVKFRLQLNQTAAADGVPPLRPYEIATRLLELAEEDSQEYYVPWARLVETIEIENERSVIFTLRYPHVRPESLITMPYFSPEDPRTSDYFGWYKPTAPIGSDPEKTIFEFNDRYEKKPERQYPRIVEKVFKNSSEATDAMLRGDIDVIDRVFPGDVPRLRKHPMITVKPYLIPTVHMLIPNPRNQYMKSDHFRRALHFGINRPLIIKEIISGGRTFDGFNVVSGPFPPGTDTADQLSYAYNREVTPREYSAKLALVLSNQYVINERIRLEKDGEENPEVEMPVITLAHPANDAIAAACEAMSQQWRAVGIKSILRPLPPGMMKPEDDDYDLLYTEIQMQEPLVDAYRLFGRGGLAKLVDPTIEQALRQLDTAYSWGEISTSLRRVHQQTANNLTILPLWQVVDSYAYRKNIFNIGSNIVFLYQNLNDWRMDGVQQATLSEKKP